MIPVARDPGFIDSIGGRVVAAVLVAVFAFFFVTVSSRIVGLVRHLVTRRQPEQESNRRREQGVLFGSGLVGGGGLAGVMLALCAALSGGEPIRGIPLALPGWIETAIALLAIAVLLALLRTVAVRRVRY